MPSVSRRTNGDGVIPEQGGSLNTSSPPSVLLLVDDPGLREALTGAAGARGHRTTVCECSAAAWDAHAQAGHALVVVGGLNDRRATEALLRRIRSTSAGGVPVIVAVAGDVRPEQCLPLLDVADDVIVMPVEAHLLELRLAAAERLARERSASTADGGAVRPEAARGIGLRLRLHRALAAFRASGGADTAPDATPPETDPQPTPPGGTRIGPARSGPAPVALELPAPPSDGARFATLEWDLKRGEIRFSREWAQLFGHQSKEVGRSPDEWFRRVHPEDLDRLKAAIAAHLEGRTPAIDERHRMARADGTYEPAVFRGVAIRDESGAPVRVAGAHADASGTRGFDSLTGLPNRSDLMERLGKVLERGRTGDGGLAAVLFLDLDRFKNINYSLGHTVGDQLLKAVADRLRACLAGAETKDSVRTTISHVGGDEFAILLDGIADANDAVRAARRIHDELQGAFSVEGNEVFTSTSIGIAVATPEYNRAEDLLRDADTAMFRAKALGTGSYVVFDTGMHARAVSLLKLETELRRAVQREEFRVFYQPIVELESGRIVGFEALVRWQHPDGELLLPKDFLTVAEETGLIIGIDRQVARDACKQLRSWSAQFRRSSPLTVSLNVSGVQFQRPDMIVEIDRTLRDYGVWGRSVKLEITESVMMEHARYAADLLQQLKSLDIKLSIDDFGTGYSSLSYLRRFEIDTLKVDSSFVSRMDTDEDSWEIIRTIVTMGNNLGKDVVAEGIERGRQRDLLLALRCKYGQGFFFSRPVDAEAATALLVADAAGRTLLRSSG